MALITTSASSQGNAVTLVSTLKQSSLCPEDSTTTFTCTAIGTHLIWIVGGRILPFNADARVGRLRSNLEEDATAILLHISVNGYGPHGYAVRQSVLTVDARPLTTEMLSVRCHNGSDQFSKEMLYLPSVAEPPYRPETIESTFINHGNRRIANISWSAPSLNPVDINFYAVSVDDGLPMLIKNTSIIILFNPTSSEQEHVLSLRAVDKCGRQGDLEEVTVTVPTLAVASSPEPCNCGNELEAPTLNGAKKDGLDVLTMMILCMHMCLLTLLYV